MKLTSCRVQNFRSIQDSGWVDIDDIAVIVGKNESGKTSFLKALWKFNPFSDAPYNIDREWPSSRRREKSPDKIVVTARFAFTADEISAIEKIHESARGITGVEITRNYAGDYSHKFLPKHPGDSAPLLRMVELVHAQLPTFIYMDDFRTFVGAAQLDEVLKHQQAKHLTPEEETIIAMLNVCGLNLEKEVQKGNADDRLQRNLDLEDASKTLTALIAKNWRQRKYQVQFRADGQHFNTYVKDETDEALIPLEDRSKGFQWFFSFDMRFMHETGGQFENAILLLDEPGLHLHASAQHDLLDRLREYARGNQMIYTTHLPFMIDFKRLDNLYVAEEIPQKGVVIHKNWATADKDARFTLQAALGLAWSETLFAGPYNLIVEGADDYWFITTFSTLFEESGLKGLHPELVITPSGGATKAAYIGTMLHSQKLNVAVLLDSDPDGEQAHEQLVHRWILDSKYVLMPGDVLGLKRCSIEDFFAESFYLNKVNEAYARELAGRRILLDPKTAGKKTIIERVQDGFSTLGFGKFSKARVSKRIISELAKKNLGAVDADTVAKFRKLIDAINAIVATWKKS